MNRLNAKRIGVLAASLLFGLAVAGPVSLSNIPIINSAGQPVVQVVVGSTAQPSDGVVAANIAAVIGNLAFTSTPVTATVGGTSGVTCAVTTPSCSVTNQQVYLGESGGISVSSGSYAISALIGSVLNQAIILGSPISTKSVVAGTSYAFPRGSAVAASPADSPYSASAWVPTSTTPNAASNGGGFSQSSFTNSTYDNIVQLTSAQLPSLLNNAGSYGESEYLWLTGFPVYNQQTSPSVKSFEIMSAGGAYQAVFNKPIHEPANTLKAVNNAAFTLLGQNWTIVGYTLPGSSSSLSSTTTVAGGKLQLASSLVPIKTVYVGQNLTSGGFTVELTDLGQANSGISPASVSVFYNGVLTNTTSINPNTTTSINVTGHTLDVHIGTTFAGLYAYQKWAKMQLYSNVYNITNGQVFNQTNDPGWRAQLLWTNTSGATTPTDLQSIVVYNTTPTNLLPGQSFDFIQMPKAYQVTFVGDELGSTNYDGVTFQPQFASSVEYVNRPSTGSAGTIKNVTEPAQELIVTSSVGNAFSYGGQTSSSMTYLLGSYGLAVGTGAGVLTTFKISDSDATSASFVSATNPLNVQITGAQAHGGSTVTYSYTVDAVGSASNILGTSAGTGTGVLYNVTSIEVTGGIVPGLSITATDANSVVLGSLIWNSTPSVLYTQSGQVYYGLAKGTSVTYNQQNGQPTTTFSISGTALDATLGKNYEYYAYSLNEYNVPGQTSGDIDQLSFAVTNSLSGSPVSSPYMLNSTKANLLNVTYENNAGTTFDVQQGFVTERGSKVASVSPSAVSLDLAKSVDQLELVVGTAASNVTTKTSGKTVGPYSVGQQTNIANVTIANVTAKCSFTTTSCTVTGLENVTATPSVTSAVTPVSLNTATTPLTVLDSNANSASTLIVVGSKYVNSVAAQIFAQNPTLDSSFGPSSVIEQAEGSNRILVAGYYANQTVQAGNQFIEALLSAAST